MEGAIILIIWIGSIVAWVFAGIKAYKFGQKRGITRFILHLFGSFAAIFVLWMIILYPVLGCRGFLCGIGEFIIWILVSTVVFAIWPVILIFYFNRKYKNQSVVKFRDAEDILDSEV